MKSDPIQAAQGNPFVLWLGTACEWLPRLYPCLWSLSAPYVWSDL